MTNSSKDLGPDGFSCRSHGPASAPSWHSSAGNEQNDLTTLWQPKCPTISAAMQWMRNIRCSVDDFLVVQCSSCSNRSGTSSWTPGRWQSSVGHGKEWSLVKDETLPSLRLPGYTYVKYIYKYIHMMVGSLGVHWILLGIGATAVAGWPAILRLLNHYSLGGPLSWFSG